MEHGQKHLFILEHDYFAEVVAGCMDDLALNYNEDANVDGYKNVSIQQNPVQTGKLLIQTLQIHT